MRWACSSVRPSVCLSIAKMRTQKRDFVKKLRFLEFKALVSIDDPWEILHGVFKQPIIGPTAPVLLANYVTIANARKNGVHTAAYNL